MLFSTYTPNWAVLASFTQKIDPRAVYHDNVKLKNIDFGAEDPDWIATY